MPITLLLGPAGSGKTHHCLQRLREAQGAGRAGETLLLVPAQNTYSLRAALPTEGMPVVLDTPILSLDARDPAHSFGGWLLRGDPRPWKRCIDATGQILVLKRLLAAHAGEALRESARTLGF